MPQLSTSKIHTFLAKQFRESIDESSPSRLYYFIGRNSGWGAGNAVTPINTNLREINDWKEMLAAKKVRVSDIKLVVPRHNWEANVVFNAYHANSVLKANTKFYAYNANNKSVYLCVSNGSGNLSVNVPTSLGTNLEEKPDGYIWKYLYTIDTTSDYRFVNDSWMPVLEDEEVQSTTHDRGVEWIDIKDGGYYQENINCSISVVGDGSGFIGRANIQSGNVVDITIEDPGAGYTYANLSVVYTGAGAYHNNANLWAVLSPAGGLGYDPYEQLNAHSLMLNTQLVEAENDKFTVNSSYRMVGLVLNPIERNSGKVAQNLRYRQTTILNLDGKTPGYFGNVNGVVQSNLNAKANVVHWDETNNLLYVTAVNGSFSATNDTVYAMNTAATAVGINSITHSELMPQTGDILYISYSNAITRADDQTENIQIVLEF